MQSACSYGSFSSGKNGFNCTKFHNIQETGDSVANVSLLPAGFSGRYSHSCAHIQNVPVALLGILAPIDDHRVSSILRILFKPDGAGYSKLRSGYSIRSLHYIIEISCQSQLRSCHRRLRYRIPCLQRNSDSRLFWPAAFGNCYHKRCTEPGELGNLHHSVLLRVKLLRHGLPAVLLSLRLLIHYAASSQPVHQPKGGRFQEIKSYRQHHRDPDCVCLRLLVLELS